MKLLAVSRVGLALRIAVVVRARVAASVEDAPATPSDGGGLGSAAAPSYYDHNIREHLSKSHDLKPISVCGRFQEQLGQLRHRRVPCCELVEIPSETAVDSLGVFADAQIPFSVLAPDHKSDRFH